MSWSSRLISAGLPAPSQSTTSKRARRSASASSTTRQQLGLVRRGTRPRSSWRWAGPSRRPGSCARPSASAGSGSSPTSGSTPAASACIACARPISWPDGVTDRVERHVLRLERRDAHAAAGEDAAQRGDDGRLARVRRGAAHHETAAQPAVGRDARAGVAHVHCGPVPHPMTSPASTSVRLRRCPGSRIIVRLLPSSPERPWRRPPPIGGGRFAPRSQLRDSPGFAPVFPRPRGSYQRPRSRASRRGSRARGKGRAAPAPGARAVSRRSRRSS